MEGVRKKNSWGEGVMKGRTKAYEASWRGIQMTNEGQRKKDLKD